MSAMFLRLLLSLFGVVGLAVVLVLTRDDVPSGRAEAVDGVDER